MTKMSVDELETRAKESAEIAKKANYFRDTVSSSHQMVRLVDYRVAQDGDISKRIYFGSQNPKCPFPHMVEDVRQKGTDSDYYNSVLCPLTGLINREGDNGKWEFYKNMAFWAGGMDAGRTFVLVTNIAWYYNKGKPDPDSGACREILWLLFNGYTAEVDSTNIEYTIFLPSSTSTRGIFSIFKDGDPKKETAILERLIRRILSERTVLASRQRANLFFGFKPKRNSQNDGGLTPETDKEHTRINQAPF